MKRLFLSCIFIVSLIGITTVSFAAYIIFDDKIEDTNIKVKPSEVQVSNQDFETVSFSQVTNQVQCNSNAVFSDLFQIEMIFNNDYYYNTINPSFTDKGALHFEMHVPSSELYNYISMHIGNGFINFQYNDYYLQAEQFFGDNNPRYKNNNTLINCFNFDNESQIIDLIIPFAPEMSENDKFYFTKIIDDNKNEISIQQTKNWKFKVNFNFGVIGAHEFTTDFNELDFSNIALSICGVSLD